MQFVGVQVFLLRVNRACKACTASIAVAVGSNLDKPLEAVVVEQSHLPVVHCSSLTGLLESWSVACSSIVGLGVALSLVHRWSIAGPSRVCLFVCLFVWLFLCPSCIVRPSARLVAPASLVHRWSIAGPSLVHRWSIAHPSVPLSLVHRASLWLLLCPSCIADASLVCLLVHRSSVCLCTARPSAGPSVGVTIAAASLGRRVPHQWKARMLFWCCRRRNREGL